MSVVARLLQRLSGAMRSETAAIGVLEPSAGPVYAVGDAHGRLDLLLDIEAAIQRDASAFAGRATVVLLGDMIDRGPSSAALIDHLLRPPLGTLRRVCLMGNHEAMMLDFLASPRDGIGWLAAGGAETLASYGVTLDAATLAHLSDRKLRQIIGAHVPEPHVAFLRGTSAGVQVGAYLLAHAGVDALAPLTAQPLQALLWGSAGRAAPAGLTLVHGHYATATPEVEAGRIGIDTGAYATGHLTALRLAAGHPPALFTTRAAPHFRPLPRQVRQPQGDDGNLCPPPRDS